MKPEYEYKILKTETPTASEEQLNSYGKDGWLLQTIYPWAGNGDYDPSWYYVFYRVKD